jgi:hypothetical protein
MLLDVALFSLQFVEVKCEFGMLILLLVRLLFSCQEYLNVFPDEANLIKLLLGIANIGLEGLLTLVLHPPCYVECLNAVRLVFHWSLKPVQMSTTGQ